MQNFWTEFISFIYRLVNMLELDSAYRYIVLVFDVAIVTIIFYYIYKFIKETRAKQIIKGILILVALLLVSKIFNMVILKFILTNFMTYGVLLIIVIFQPEIRNGFERIGRSKISDVFETDSDNMLIKHSIAEIVKAVEIMSLKQIGALIVIERETKLSEVLKEGVALNSKISSELIQNIFTPRTPLHDGAVVIEKNQILAAKCILPLASESAVEKSLGTRHRASVGITEISDALVIVVSEETGIISLAESGKLTRNLTGDKLKSILLKKLDKSAVKNTRLSMHK